MYRILPILVALLSCCTSCAPMGPAGEGKNNRSALDSALRTTYPTVSGQQVALSD